MNETEIDALMQGQEDENGSVNYEGQFKSFIDLTEHLLTTVKCLMVDRFIEIMFVCCTVILTLFNLSILNSFRQTHHVCVRSRSCE